MVSIRLTPPPPLVSNGQLSAYPPSPLRQQWSAFAIPPPPPPAADVICEQPLMNEAESCLEGVRRLTCSSRRGQIFEGLVHPLKLVKIKIPFGIL